MEKIVSYIYNFLDTHFNDYQVVLKSEQTAQKNRERGLHSMKNGDFFMNLLTLLVDNTEKIYTQDPIPTHFTTPEKYIKNISNFLNQLKSPQIQEKLETLEVDDRENEFLKDVLEFKNDLIDMLEYAIELYNFDVELAPYKKLRTQLLEKDIDGFIDNIKSILSGISYNAEKNVSEGVMQVRVYIILKLLGFKVENEVETNIGRIDLTIELPNKVYVIELKAVDNGEEIAMEQIERKKYYEKFIVDGKEILFLAINFDKVQRNIGDYKFKTLDDYLKEL